MPSSLVRTSLGLVRVAAAVTAFGCGPWPGTPAGSAEPPAAVTVTTDKVSYEVTAGGTNAIRTETLQQIVLENEYVRAVILPELGGRIAQVYDKVAGADMFLKAYPPLVCQPERRWSSSAGPIRPSGNGWCSGSNYARATPCCGPRAATSTSTRSSRASRPG